MNKKPFDNNRATSKKLNTLKRGKRLRNNKVKKTPKANTKIMALNEAAIKSSSYAAGSIELNSNASDHDNDSSIAECFDEMIIDEHLRLIEVFFK